MKSFTKLKNSDELDLKALMKELGFENSSQIYQICIENAENQGDAAQVEIPEPYCDLAEVFSGCWPKEPSRAQQNRSVMEIC